MNALDTVRTMLNMLLTILSELGVEPRTFVNEVLDAHPLVDAVREDLRDALDRKFGPTD